MTKSLIPILLLAAIAPSGKCILLDPQGNLSKIDETKLTRFHFDVQPKNTGHTIRAGEAVFEVLNLSGIEAGETGAYSVPTYNAAHRIALGIVRCAKFECRQSQENVDADEALTVSEFLALPQAVQEAYLSAVEAADRPAQEDWDFFKKPASAGGKSGSEKSATENKTA